MKQGIPEIRERVAVRVESGEERALGTRLNLAFFRMAMSLPVIGTVFAIPNI